ncbi:hypothetical protein POV27_04570 [Aureisphaera galaxeae]|uniref:hypothetical protein n=1 Tax=Aureisphaera galaxeae TaxID=1538023 RepID=UPI00234FB8B8|nr:hypothetical protein [Aureisphaera galaxeae]MDC8003311.1 hypothetical protein [Aureisphaera galaxeae]
MIRAFFKKINRLFSSELDSGEDKTLDELKKEEEVLNAKLDALEEMEEKLKDVIK